MTPADLLAGRVAALKKSVADAAGSATGQSIGFANAILIGQSALLCGAEGANEDLTYGGAPALARIGYGLSEQSDRASQEAFLQAVQRARGRPTSGREQLGSDDIALLGIASGIVTCARSGHDVGAAATWLIGLAEETTAPQLWSRRARSLAADLLDNGGRLRAAPAEDRDVLALDLALRQRWPDTFASVSMPNRILQQSLMGELLIEEAPPAGDLGRAATWLAAVSILVRRASADLVPDVDSLVETLKATQSAFRRWVWEIKPRRTTATPARWLIDNEAHVQAFLWAVLEPRYGDQLVDEQYLPGFGQLQPRFDFGVSNLKTIIEVKVLRTPGDFTGVEQEVAADAAIYFSEPERFDRMIVYIYDDCDHHRPERYDTLRSAILARDSRIIDTVLVRRPGMMPARDQRTLALS